MKLLVTGRSGTGKTTIHHELLKHSVNSVDADRAAGLASWVDRKTLQPVRVDYSHPIDTTKVGWYWAKTALEAIMAESENIVLCGSAHNQLDYYDCFDKVIFLDVSPQEQARRILARTEHNYGQTTGMVERILREQSILKTASMVRGAIIMNANRPVSDTALSIIKHTRR